MSHKRFMGEIHRNGMPGRCFVELGQKQALLSRHYVFKGKFTQEDHRLFLDLQRWSTVRKRPLFLVRNVSENLEERQRHQIAKDLSKHMGVDIQNLILFVSCKTKADIDKLKSEIYTLDVKKIRRDRINRAFEQTRDSWLKKAKATATDKVFYYSKGAALNGINPFVGADVAVDAGIYLLMFSSIRDCYDIEEADFKEYMVIPIAKKLLELLTKQGVCILIKNFAGKQVARNLLKCVPFAGQAISIAVGYSMANSVGKDYNVDCYQFSKRVMNKLIEAEIKKFA